MKRILTLLILLTISAHLSADNSTDRHTDHDTESNDYKSAEEWVLEREDNDIKVYRRSIANSAFSEIRATTTVNSTLRKLVCFLQDESINTNWVPYSGGANILERPDQYRTYVHFRVNAQWPFKDRDTVALFTLSQNSETHAVRIAMESTPNKIATAKNSVRINTYSGFWELTPLSNTKTAIIYQNHLDPGGHIPSWIANPVAYKSTFTSLLNLKSQIEDYRHEPQLFQFIRNND